ncbi:hypothetical protein ACSXEK_15930 (plasmid) [Clostridium perfringens]|uniref:Uncharacterized protein n=1 Tax=Veillonella parvula TaxID=29466 RepID=A0A942WVL1_VEIPA|nr:hypothetical protein [Veillonella parvula]MBS4893749.1 hypothetical protein [Veillonella parvula]
MRINNCFEAAMKMVELNKEIMQINDQMRKIEESSIQYNVLKNNVDQKYSEFLSIKHTLQNIKMPIVI